MKITYISNSSCPSHVPSSLQIVKTCEYLSKAKNNVSLIIPNTSQSKLSIFNFYNIKFKFNIIRMTRFNKFPLGLSYYWFSILCFWKAYKLSEIIISRNFFVIFLCIMFRKKCIIELHHEIRIESRIVQFIYKIFNIFDNQHLMKTVAISHAIKNKFIKDFDMKDFNKIIVLPSGTSLKMKFLNPTNKKRLQLGYFGSINSSKGINLIFELAKLDPGNDYFIYGGLNNQISKLKLKNTMKNLFLFPHQNYRRINKYLLKMDILLIPYTNKVTAAGNVSNIAQYTSPLKLFDYMSAGKLIISSELDVLKEILTDRYNCLFVKNYLNPHAWIMTIKKIKLNMVMRQIVSKNSFKKVKEFHHEKRTKKYLEI